MRAQLSASVPPQVKIISDGLQFSLEAMSLRTVSIMAFAFRPSPWVLLGLPKFTMALIIADLASPDNGVVAALSKYMLIKLKKLNLK